MLPVPWGNEEERNRRFRPSLERLEYRLPFAADLAIDVDLGEVDAGLDADEYVVAGGVGNAFFSADGTALENGGHLFVYTQEQAGSVDIFARITLPDGSPGAPPTRLVTVQVGTSQNAFQNVLFSTSGTEDGGIVLAWSDGFNIFLQRFDANLESSSSVVQVAQSSSASASSFQVTSLTVLERLNGKIAVAYNDPATDKVTLKEYTSDLSGAPSTWQDPSTSNHNESNALHIAVQELAANDVRLSWVSNDLSNPSSWTIYTTRIDGGSTIDHWGIDNFVDLPQFIYQTDGDIVLSGVEQQNGNYRTVVRLYDSQKTLVMEDELSDQFATIADLHSIAILDDDTFAVAGFFGTAATDGLFLQAYNSDGQTIGELERINQSGSNTQMHSGIFGLDSGGFATYWLGYALDGVSPAVFSRTVKLEATELIVSIEDSNSVVDTSNDFIVIDGLPAEVGLNVGTRLSETSWKIPVNQLHNLEILNFGEREQLTLSVALLSSSNSDVLATDAAKFGSEEDDIFIVDAFDDFFDGREGEDTAYLSGNAEEFKVQELESGKFQVTDLFTAVDLIFENVEALAFYDQTLSLEEFSTTGASGNSSSGANSYAPNEYPIDEFEFESFEGPSSYEADEYGEFGNKSKLFEEFDEVMDLEFGKWLNNEEFGESLFAELGPSGPDMLPFDDALADAHDASLERLGPESSDEVEIELELESELEPELEASKLVSKEARDDSEPLHAEGEGPLAAVAMGEFDPNTAEALPTDAIVLQITQDPNGIHSGIGQQATSATGLPQPVVVQQATVKKLGSTFVAQAQPHVFANPAVAAASTSIDAMAPVGSGAVFENELLTVAPAFDAELLFENLDTVAEEVRSDQAVAEVVVGSAVVVATGMSIAHIAWLLRGSVLITKLMSSMPIWISFDPLPLLRNTNPTMPGDGPNESLVDIASAGK